MQSKRFTLIELLVVLAIIGILLTLLLPSITKARQEAESVVCKSNTKQISIGIFIWSKEYNGKIPSAYSEYEGGYDFWHIVMLKILDAPYQLMNCPTGWNEQENVVLRKISQQAGRSDYGWNWSGYNTTTSLFGLGNDPRSNLTFTHRGGSAYMAKIQDPAHMITFGDRGKNWDVRSSIGNTNFAVQDVMPMIHKNSSGGNIFFLDGSIKFMTAAKLYSPNSKSMWSKAND